VKFDRKLKNSENDLTLSNRRKMQRGGFENIMNQTVNYDNTDYDLNNLTAD
jgi:hypothetical protein